MDFSLLAIILIVALIVWLICQFAPAPGWVDKAALIVMLMLLVALAVGLRIDA